MEVIGFMKWLKNKGSSETTCFLYSRYMERVDMNPTMSNLNTFKAALNKYIEFKEGK